MCPTIRTQDPHIWIWIESLYLEAGSVPSRDTRGAHLWTFVSDEDLPSVTRRPHRCRRGRLGFAQTDTSWDCSGRSDPSPVTPHLQVAESVLTRLRSTLNQTNTSSGEFYTCDERFIS